MSNQGILSKDSKVMLVYRFICTVVLNSNNGGTFIYSNIYTNDITRAL